MIQRLNGKRLRVNGKTARSEACCCGEPDPCACDTLTIVFDGTVIQTDCRQDVSFFMQFHQSVGAATFDGTYTLTRQPGLCRWVGSFTGVEFRFWATGSCSGPFDVSNVGEIVVELEEGAGDWTWYVSANVVRSPGSSAFYQLFGKSILNSTIGCRDIADLGALANTVVDINGEFGGEDYAYATGGTATLSEP